MLLSTTHRQSASRYGQVYGKKLKVWLGIKRKNMKYFTIIYLMILTFHCTAQVVKSKDGVSLGKRSEFLSSCTKGADKKLMNINGVEIEAYKYCACVCDNLIPTINSWEMRIFLISFSLAMVHVLRKLLMVNKGSQSK